MSGKIIIIISLIARKGCPSEKETVDSALSTCVNPPASGRLLRYMSGLYIPHHKSASFTASPVHFYENTAELKAIGDIKCLGGHNFYLLLTGGREEVKVYSSERSWFSKFSRLQDVNFCAAVKPSP